jgi:hypothetical protein
MMLPRSLLVLLSPEKKAPLGGRARISGEDLRRGEEPQSHGSNDQIQNHRRRNPVDFGPALALLPGPP